MGKQLDEVSKSQAQARCSRAPWQRITRKVLQRDERQCQLRLPGCLVDGDQVDHVIAVSRGGTDDMENCSASCTVPRQQDSQRIRSRTQPAQTQTTPSPSRRAQANMKTRHNRTSDPWGSDPATIDHMADWHSACRSVRNANLLDRTFSYMV